MTVTNTETNIDCYLQSNICEHRSEYPFISIWCIKIYMNQYVTDNAQPERNRNKYITVLNLFMPRIITNSFHLPITRVNKVEFRVFSFHLGNISSRWYPESIGRFVYVPVTTHSAKSNEKLLSTSETVLSLHKSSILWADFDYSDVEKYIVK